MNTLSLDTLRDNCQRQIQQFRAGNASERSAYCTEIVHRAAAGDEAALILLMDLSTTLIRPRCMVRRPDLAEEILQEVSIKLWKRFQNRENPFVVTTFAAFYTYLSLTFRSVLGNIEHAERMEPPPLPLPLGNDDNDDYPPGHEPSYRPDLEAVERRELIEELLELLPDAWEREALRDRYLRGETHEEMRATLASMKGKELPDRDTFDTYRLVERALDRLRNSLKARYILSKFEDC